MADLTSDKCCFCIDLRVECLIIGYLYLIVEMIVALFGGLALKRGIHPVGDIVELIEGMSSIIVIIAISAVFFAFTIVLLIGLHQEKRSYVEAYLLGTAIMLVLLFLGTLMMIGSAPDLLIAVTIVGIVISVYFLLCIRSYHSKMETSPQTISNN